MALREVFARFITRFEGGALARGQAQVGGLTSSLEGAIGKLASLGTAFAALAIVQQVRAWIGAVAEFVAGIVEVGDELADASARLGISTDALQAWRHAANQSGVGAEQLGTALQFLQRNTAEAARGHGAAVAVFRRLGVAAVDAAGGARSVESILPELADRISALPRATDRTAAAMDLFGRSGARLLPLLMNGAAGLEEFRAEMERLGGGASPEMIAAAAALDDAMNRLDFATLSLKSRLAVALLPVIERGVNLITELTAWFARNEAAALALKIAVIAITGAITVMAIVVAIVLSPILLLLLFLFGVLALVVGVLILVVEDLYTWFTGGNSVIGSFIESLLALAGISLEDIREEVRSLMETLANAYNSIAEALGLPTIQQDGFVDTSNAGPKQEGRRPPATGGAEEETSGQRFLQSLRVSAAEFRAPDLAGVVRPAVGGRSGDRTVNQRTEIAITGSDPRAIAREVERVIDRQNRDASEALAQ